MSVRQPKSQSTTFIEVVGRPGGKKGQLELTSGNVKYYRAGAKTETLSLTYQQLLSMLEQHLEHESINTKNVKLPKPRKEGDFTIEVFSENSIGEMESIFGANCSLKKFDPRTIDCGSYQLTEDIANGRPSKKHTWFAHVSIQAALWIINRYIDKFLVGRKMSNFTDKDIVVSKQQMRLTLLMLFKKVDA